MAQEETSQITKYMRTLLNKYSQLRGKEKSSGCMEFWDAVILTAADTSQKSAFELQLEAKITRQELPVDLPVHVVSDPPGVRVGNGGSTLTALEFLEQKYRDKLFEMKILLIHAGGWSQRMPSASVLGKVFSILPHGSPPFQMLDLKLALYWPLVAKMGAGIFLVCADDFVVFDLGTDEDWVIPREGFTALAHPSDITIGRSHGVFVIAEDENLVTSRHVQLLKCVEVLQKPDDARMKHQGALLKGNTHQFADGICLEGEVVYTDSCFYFGVDVMEKLVKFKKSVGDLNCEIDAYGDFLQAVGKNATSDYVYNISNVSQPTENLIEMRKKVFTVLNKCEIHILALNASTFIHIGTTKELTHHLCRDQDFQDKMVFVRDAFNRWFEGSHTYGGNETNPENERQETEISKFTCIVHSSLAKESVIEDDCFLEFCDFEVPIQVSQNAILSNCQISKSEAFSGHVNIPENTFLHTIPVCAKDNAREYVTVFFRTDDNLKKATSLMDVESLSFLGSDVGQYLYNQGLRLEHILPKVESDKQSTKSNQCDSQSNTDTKTKSGVKMSLWTLKLYPGRESMTSSFENALHSLHANGRQKIPRISQRLYSLEEVIKLKDVEDMLSFRDVLYKKIKDSQRENQSYNTIIKTFSTER